MAISTQLRGTILVALSGMLFGMMGFTGTKIINFHFSVENMLFWRFLIATLCLCFSTVLFRPAICKPTANLSSVIKVFIFSALTYSGASGFYFLASDYIGTGLAMVIFFCFPVFVTLFAWTLGTWKMNKLALMALLAVVSGLFLLKGSGAETLDQAGIIWAIVAALCFAAYVYGSQRTTQYFDSGLLALLVCFGNTLVFLAISLYTHSFVFPTSWEAWFYICAIAIIATALPIQLLLDGLKYISPVKASILSALEPVVTMSYTQTIGVMVVLLGAILIQFERTNYETS
jgi:drug/metabolite transporter (DMT)-like permease